METELVIVVDAGSCENSVSNAED